MTVMYYLPLPLEMIPRVFEQLFNQSLQNGGKNDAAAVYGM